MKSSVSIVVNSQNGYDLHAVNLAWDEVVQVRQATDKIQHYKPTFQTTEYLGGEEIGYDVQQALMIAARLYYAGPGNGNKIITIKHIRTLSAINGRCLGLKDAKDLVDYAIHVADAPVWWKAV